MLLTHRQFCRCRRPSPLSSDLRGTLRNFGLKGCMVAKVKFEARNLRRRLVETLPDLAVFLVVYCPAGVCNILLPYSPVGHLPSAMTRCASA